MRQLLNSLAVVALALALIVAAAPRAARAAGSLADAIERVQPKIVKIYGAGGFGKLEAYQSGMLISADGYVLTSWSYVLDADDVLAVLDDGRRFEAKLIGADVRLELAVLKIEADGLKHFDLNAAAKADVGAAVLAFSNLYGVAAGAERASVQHGVVSAVAPLNARRGAFQTAYKGDVLVVDAMTNNPGAAGGALTDRNGKLLGVLGKELRNAQTNAWLNYAIPVAAVREQIADVIAGKGAVPPDDDVPMPEKALDLTMLGITLVPDVLPKTPPFVDQIRSDSPADRAGMKADDLLVLIDDSLVQSCRAAVEELARIDRVDSVRITAMRGDELVEFTLQAPREALSP
jgi:serine protease Do